MINDMNGKKLFLWLAGVVLGCALASRGAAQGAERPNILWIVAEDIGLDLGCYGTEGVHTPHLDQLAAEGALYRRAYTTAAICSPSRSSFMTGLYPHQVFSKNMRIRPPLEKQPLPEGVDVFTRDLRETGYAIGFPGHQKTDWGFKDPARAPYDIKDWEALTARKPFFCQFQFYDVHRVNLVVNGKQLPFEPCPEHPVDRTKARLQPYIPETPAAREEQGAYLENINRLDLKVGALIADLKAKGLYEDTVIVVMGDNGPPLFRGKGFLYERGLLMPLIVRVPARFNPGFRPGTVSDELVSALDIAPTFISLAGGKVPGYMEGRIFFGPNKQPEPQYLFGLRDRLEENVDRVRSVCGKRYKYIRNFLSEKSCYEVGHKNVAAVSAGLALFHEGKLPPVQSAYYQTRAQEELYDLANDPHELINLVGLSEHHTTLRSLRAVLDNWIAEKKDDGKFEDPAMLKEMDRRWDEFVKKRRERPEKSSKVPTP
jgi:N-sulfoglucosamine sulfohydrolase